MLIKNTIGTDGEKQFQDLIQRIVSLHEAKAHDYGAGSGDILHNYRFSAQMAGIKTSRGIFARLCEKVTRVSSLLDKDVRVKDETITDTCLDMAVISLLLIIAFNEEKANLFELDARELPILTGSKDVSY